MKRRTVTIASPDLSGKDSYAVEAVSWGGFAVRIIIMVVIAAALAAFSIWQGAWGILGGFVGVTLVFRVQQPQRLLRRRALLRQGKGFTLPCSDPMLALYQERTSRLDELASTGTAEQLLRVRMKLFTLFLEYSRKPVEDRAATSNTIREKLSGSTNAEEQP